MTDAPKQPAADTEDSAAGAAPADTAEPQETAAPPAEGESSPEALRARWLRAEADLQNYRRRAQREREEARRASEEAVLLEMISVLDDLERAIQASRDAGAPPDWTQGVELVAARVREALARYSVTRLDPIGQPFDPRFHEALMEMDTPEGTAPGTVLQVIHPGYARGDRALRAARVVVARHPEGG